MKPKAFELLQRCIEDGISIGHTRAYKHNDAPPPDTINHQIYEAIMNELFEWFDFPEGNEL